MIRYDKPMAQQLSYYYYCCVVDYFLMAPTAMSLRSEPVYLFFFSSVDVPRSVIPQPYQCVGSIWSYTYAQEGLSSWRRGAKGHTFGWKMMAIKRICHPKEQQKQAMMWRITSKKRNAVQRAIKKRFPLFFFQLIMPSYSHRRLILNYYYYYCSWRCWIKCWK